MPTENEYRETVLIDEERKRIEAQKAELNAWACRPPR